MQFFMLALLTVTCTTVVPVVLGLIMNRRMEDVAGVVAKLASLTILYTLVVGFLMWIHADGIHGPFPLWWQIILGLGLSVYILQGMGESRRDSSSDLVYGIMIFLTACYLFYGVVINHAWNVDYWKGKQKAELAQAEVIRYGNGYSYLLPEEDHSKVWELSIALATQRIKDSYECGAYEFPRVTASAFEIDKVNVQEINGRDYAVATPKFHGWRHWRHNPIIPGFFMLDLTEAEADPEFVDHNAQGEPLSIRYLPTASYSAKVERRLRYNGYMNAVLGQMVFQPDDSLNPYVLIPHLDRRYGISNHTFKGLIIMDAQTGKFKEVEPDSIPEWVDWGFPYMSTYQYVKKWGQWHDKSYWQEWGVMLRSMDVEDTKWIPKMRGDHGPTAFKCMLGKDNDAVAGFTQWDLVTGEFTFVQTHGITQSSAEGIANAMWTENNKGVRAEYPHMDNIGGLLTYVFPMAYGTQFKGISLVSFEDRDIHARGETLEEAIEAYLRNQ